MKNLKIVNVPSRDLEGINRNHFVSLLLRYGIKKFELDKFYIIGDHNIEYINSIIRKNESDENPYKYDTSFTSFSVNGMQTLSFNFNDDGIKNNISAIITKIANGNTMIIIDSTYFSDLIPVLYSINSEDYNLYVVVLNALDDTSIIKNDTCEDLNKDQMMYIAKQMKAIGILYDLPIITSSQIPIHVWNDQYKMSNLQNKIFKELSDSSKTTIVNITEKDYKMLKNTGKLKKDVMYIIDENIIESYTTFISIKRQALSYVGSIDFFIDVCKEYLKSINEDVTIIFIDDQITMHEINVKLSNRIPANKLISSVLKFNRVDDDLFNTLEKIDTRVLVLSKNFNERKFLLLNNYCDVDCITSIQEMMKKNNEAFKLEMIVKSYDKMRRRYTDYLPDTKLFDSVMSTIKIK